MNPKVNKPKADEADTLEKLPFCGIIMPIAAMGQYEKSHWERVRLVLDEAIEDAGYTPRLVSESEDIGVIHARIVQNLYDDPIVVCDVSGKNANVMFELGLRLAFDKPTIVIKDDQTDYSFDTSPIEHLGYGAALRFDEVRDFKKRLKAAIDGTVEKKKHDPKYSSFLGHFGRFEIAGLETKEVGAQQFIVEQLAAIQAELTRLASLQSPKQVVAERNSAVHKVTEAMVTNLVSSVLSLTNPNLSDDLELYHFFERVEQEMKSRNIKLPEQAFLKIVYPLVQEYRTRKTE